eukprot:CAMPEP_0204534712 /NCGR_PEP_ID=MMETSP0661-20131031/13151_1 /ASSEMBLY_ACC=CAM_ASM_000606 /TAXON_ID=109239 /ORGANISM="Alexandrium margalefi, Strain AMGDE01CS-322" /LENGTH=36 /DNA_ID= /DNA_START= /DNA_END= /DNA_ORIENTATION=
MSKGAFADALATASGVLYALRAGVAQLPASLCLAYS